MLTALLAAATIATSPVASHAAERGDCRTAACLERVARKQCSQAAPVPCIRRAALHWRVPFATLLRKAKCESHLHPLAYFSRQIAETAAERRFALDADRSSGLLAFKPDTFRSTPYGRGPGWSIRIWRAKWNALAGGWMHHVGRGGEWSCT